MAPSGSEKAQQQKKVRAFKFTKSKYLEKRMARGRMNTFVIVGPEVPSIPSRHPGVDPSIHLGREMSYDHQELILLGESTCEYLIKQTDDKEKRTVCPRVLFMRSPNRVEKPSDEMVKSLELKLRGLPRPKKPSTKTAEAKRKYRTAFKEYAALVGEYNREKERFVIEMLEYEQDKILYPKHVPHMLQTYLGGICREKQRAIEFHIAAHGDDNAIGSIDVAARIDIKTFASVLATYFDFNDPREQAALRNRKLKFVFHSCNSAYVNAPEGVSDAALQELILNESLIGKFYHEMTRPEADGGQGFTNITVSGFHGYYTYHPNKKTAVVMPVLSNDSSSSPAKKSRITIDASGSVILPKSKRLAVELMTYSRGSIVDSVQAPASVNNTLSSADDSVEDAVSVGSTLSSADDSAGDAASVGINLSEDDDPAHASGLSSHSSSASTSSGEDPLTASSSSSSSSSAAELLNMQSGLFNKVEADEDDFSLTEFDETDLDWEALEQSEDKSDDKSFDDKENLNNNKLKS